MPPRTGVGGSGWLEWVMSHSQTSRFPSRARRKKGTETSEAVSRCTIHRIPIFWWDSRSVPCCQGSAGISGRFANRSLDCSSNTLSICCFWSFFQSTLTVWIVGCCSSSGAFVFLCNSSPCCCRTASRRVLLFWVGTRNSMQMGIFHRFPREGMVLWSTMAANAAASSRWMCPTFCPERLCVGVVRIVRLSYQLHVLPGMCFAVVITNPHHGSRNETRRHQARFAAFLVVRFIIVVTDEIDDVLILC